MKGEKRQFIYPQNVLLGERLVAALHDFENNWINNCFTLVGCKYFMTKKLPN